MRFAPRPHPVDVFISFEVISIAAFCGPLLLRDPVTRFGAGRQAAVFLGAAKSRVGIKWISAMLTEVARFFYFCIHHADIAGIDFQSTRRKFSRENASSPRASQSLALPIRAGTPRNAPILPTLCAAAEALKRGGLEEFAALAPLAHFQADHMHYPIAC